MKPIALASTLAIALASAGLAQAADTLNTQYTQACKPYAVGKKAAKTKKEAGIEDEKTYKALTQAQELMQANKLAEAASLLEPFVEKSKKHAFDNAQVRVSLAFAYANLKQPEKAIPQLKAALGSGALPEATAANAMTNLIYMQVLAGKPAEADAAIQAFAAAGNPVGPELYGMLGQTYAQAQAWKESICPAYLAVTTAQAPKQAWFDVLMSAHWELKDQAGSEAVMRDAITRFPKEAKNWNQLKTIYLHANKDKEAVELMEQGASQGVFTAEKDLKDIAGLYINLDQPAKAAAFLEQAVAGGKLAPSDQLWKGIGQAWSQAGNDAKSVAAFGEAAKYAKTGEFDLFQGTIHSEKNQWREAIAAFQRALKKGGLKDEGQAWLYLGIAQFRAAEFKPALASLHKAAGFASSKKEAGKMIKTVQGQLQ